MTFLSGIPLNGFLKSLEITQNSHSCPTKDIFQFQFLISNGECLDTINGKLNLREWQGDWNSRSHELREKERDQLGQALQIITQLHLSADSAISHCNAHLIAASISWTENGKLHWDVKILASVGVLHVLPLGWQPLHMKAKQPRDMMLITPTK